MPTGIHTPDCVDSLSAFAGGLVKIHRDKCIVTRLVIRFLRIFCICPAQQNVAFIGNVCRQPRYGEVMAGGTGLGFNDKFTKFST